MNVKILYYEKIENTPYIYGFEGVCDIAKVNVKVIHTSIHNPYDMNVIIV